MKKVLLTLLFAFALLQAAAHPCSESAPDSIPARRGEVMRADSAARLLTIAPAERPGELALAIGTYRITLSGRPQPGKTPSRTSSDIGLAGLELGFNTLTAPDYSAYGAQAGNFLDLNTGKSIHFGLQFLKIRTALNRSRSLHLVTGLQIIWNDFALSNNVSLRREAGRVVPFELDKEYKKSKLTVVSLGIPLSLRIYLGQRFSLSPGLYGEVTLGAHTKYKKPKHKASLPGVITPFQAGASLRLQYRSFGLYGKVGITTLFRHERGAATHPVSVGLCWGF